MPWDYCEDESPMRADHARRQGLNRDAGSDWRAPPRHSVREEHATVPRQWNWQDFFALERGRGGVGVAEVDVSGPVPGDRFVRPDGVVFEPVVLGSLGERDGVVDLVEERSLVLERAEAAWGALSFSGGGLV